MLMKRLLDIIISLLVLLLSFPLIIIISFLIATKMGYPILFKQMRPGLHGKPFYVYKFRTMTNSLDSNGNLLPDGARLTPLGKFLRKYSLDELPQFVNVLKGEMSLVGPRPLLMEYLPLYSENHARRHQVKPGITGWAQVNGRNALTWEEKFDLDCWYVDNCSFWIDLKILFLTFIKVFKSEGINHGNHATMEDFTGYD